MNYSVKKRYYYVSTRRPSYKRFLVIVLPDKSELDSLVAMVLQGMIEMEYTTLYGHGSVLDVPGMQKTIAQIKQHKAPPRIIRLFKKEAIKLLD